MIDLNYCSNDVLQKPDLLTEKNTECNVQYILKILRCEGFNIRLIHAVQRVRLYNLLSKIRKTEHFKVIFSPSEKHVLFVTDVDR